MANDDIRGTVLDEDGNPVSGASVVLWSVDNPNNIVEKISDSQGEYVFKDHPDSGDRWAVGAYWEDSSGDQFNTMLQPFISSSLNAIPDTDLVHRYDATELNLSDGDSVSTWADQEGTDDLTAGVAPTYKSSVINGNPIVRHDGADDYLDVAYADISEPYQIFFVGQLQTLSGGAPVIMLDGATNGVHQIGQDLENSTDRWYLSQGSFLSAGSADRNAHILDATFRSGSSADELLKDGSLQISADAGNTASDGLTTGTRGDTAGNFSNVDLGEILVYQTDLSTSQAQDVRNYLSVKWSITI